MKKYILVSTVAAMLSGGVAVSSAASEAEAITNNQPTLVMEQAVALAKHYGQGAVIEVEFKQDGGQDFYQARVASENGDVRRLFIDAHTAELFENRADQL